MYSYDTGLAVIKYLLLSFVMMIASYFDIKKRIIPNWINVIILTIGLINLELVKSMVGLIMVPLPFLFVALLKKESIGGGDIKLIGALGFVIGLSYSYSLLMISLVFAIIFNFRYNLNKVAYTELKFPFAPFINLSWIIIEVSKIVIMKLI